MRAAGGAESGKRAALARGALARGLGLGLGLAVLAPARAVADDDAPPPLQTLVEPAGAEADLQLQRLPVQMKIRPAATVVATVAATATATATATVATTTTTAAAGASAAAEPDMMASRQATASTWRAIRERVTFQVRAGVELDTAADSGETLRGGGRLPDDFAGSRPWILGDAVVGARNILLPSLGAYFLSSFQLDARDSLASRTASIAPSDADELPIVIKAGYAEYGRDDIYRDKKLWLRGGRQFRLDGGSMFAYFDGATVGYRERTWDVSAFAGRRVALYVDTEHGLTYGATAALDLGKGGGVPLKIAGNVMGLSLEAGTRLLSVLQATYDVSRRASVNVRARLVDSGGGVELGRAGGRVKVGTQSVVFVADVEQRSGGDLAYDLASPSAVDVVQVAQRLGVGLAAPIDATTVGARIDWRSKKGGIELLAFGRAELPQGTVTTVDQRGWLEGGAALAGAPLGARGRGVWATAQYKLRRYDPAEGMEDVGSAFGDTSTSGLELLHEVAADGTLYSGGRGRRWRFNVGGFYRRYDFRSPYAEVANEGRGGGRTDLQLWVTRDVRAELAAEVASPSPVLARELGLMSSVRGAVEARW
jgi:hypothetical protein